MSSTSSLLLLPPPPTMTEILNKWIETKKKDNSITITEEDEKTIKLINGYYDALANNEPRKIAPEMVNLVSYYLQHKTFDPIPPHKLCPRPRPYTGFTDFTDLPQAFHGIFSENDASPNVRGISKESTLVYEAPNSTRTLSVSEFNEAKIPATVPPSNFGVLFNGPSGKVREDLDKAMKSISTELLITPTPNPSPV